jgi:hypothetical protein
MPKNLQDSLANAENSDHQCWLDMRSVLALRTVAADFEGMNQTIKP